MSTYTTPTTQADGDLIDQTDWNTDLVENIKYLKAITGLFGDGAVVSPSQITSDQNNYAPTGFATAVMLRVSSDAARNITGLSAGIAAGMIAIHNVGSFAITLKDESASSTAANRFALTGDVAIAPDAVVLLQYDATSARWRMIGSPKTTDAGDLTSGTLAAERLPSPIISALMPGGRLTLTSGTPVTTGDVTGAGTLYYAPYLHNQIALYDGSNWNTHSFTERSLSLTLTSGKNYDVFIYNNSGTLTLELSAAWTNDTTRADALTTQDGVYVKSGATTRRWLGTIRASGSNTTEDSNTKRFVWNLYNAVDRTLFKRDTSVTSWSYTTGSWRQANASASNQVEIVSGLTQAITMAYAAQCSGVLHIGIGYDRTNNSDAQQAHGVSASGLSNLCEMCTYRGYPAAGYHYFAMTEYGGTSGACYGEGYGAGDPRINNGLYGVILA